MQAWWDKDEIVIPRDVAYPPTRSTQQVDKQNQADMTTSQDGRGRRALRRPASPQFRGRGHRHVEGRSADGR